MTATGRVESEQQFHDEQARQRAEDFRRRPTALQFIDDEYLDHESWIRPAVALLGDLAGKRVLDYGCGHGMAAVVLARRGAKVIGFDLSADYVAEARQRAEANNLPIEFMQADAHTLPFDDASFDAIWGNAVLHHLDLAVAAAEIRRVLAPGGVAVFCEPWGGNPLLRLARRRWNYPGKGRTPDEKPLRRRDLAALRRVFPNLHWEGHQLLSMLRRTMKVPSLVERFDRVVLRQIPPLQNWCRYIVVTLQRE
jgi:SAM-dependent methyltransferase